MKNWTDKLIKKHVEDLIEETFVLSFPKPELRNYLSNFIGACETILHENISIHDNTKITRLKIALLKANILIDEPSQPDVRTGLINQIPTDSGQLTNQFFAEQVVNFKRTTLKILAQINPKLPNSVLEENKRLNEYDRRRRERAAAARNIVISGGYYVLFFFALFLLWVVVFY